MAGRIGINERKKISFLSIESGHYKFSNQELYKKIREEQLADLLDTNCKIIFSIRPFKILGIGTYSGLMSWLSYFSFDKKEDNQSNQTNTNSTKDNSSISNSIAKEEDFYSILEAPSFNEIIAKMLKGKFTPENNPNFKKDLNLIQNDPEIRTKIFLLKDLIKSKPQYNGILEENIKLLFNALSRKKSKESKSYQADKVYLPMHRKNIRRRDNQLVRY